MNPKRATQDAMFGRYRLRGRLAAGGMAEVWAAQLLAPGGFVKPMVIKRVLPELAENPSFLKMLMTEARVAARLSHANICAVFELGEVADEYYIAMEYLRGGPVSHLLKNGGPVSPSLAVALVGQACDGLHYAHEQRDASGALLGLVHRDVSPHNLFVTVDGVVKVLDFGIAKVDDGISERTEEGKVKGKLTYMSPEQLAAEPLDRRTDVWALGVVLWELLTGKRLFSGGPADTVDGIRNARVPRLAGMGLGAEAARLDDVIAVALRVDRTARFATAAELRRAMLEAAPPAGSEEIAHLVWERCGAEVRANDRRFEDGDEPPAEPKAVTSVDRLPLRADHTEPGGTSPEIEVVQPPTVMLKTPDPTTAPEVMVERSGNRWKQLAIGILLVGAAAIGALYAIRTKDEPKPAPAPVVAASPPAPTPPPSAPPSPPPAPAVQIEPAQLEPAPAPPAPAPVVKRDRPRPARPAGKGKLYLDARPWATIYVDGKKLGVTPIVGDTLSAGDHTIKAVTEDGRTKTMRITVPAGGDVRKKVVW